MNVSSALPILFSTLSIIILPSSKTLVDAQAQVTARPDRPTIDGLIENNFCGLNANQKCIRSSDSPNVIIGDPNSNPNGPNRDTCTGGVAGNPCTNDKLIVRSIPANGQPPAGQGTCEIERCDLTIDDTCNPDNRQAEIYWRQSATNRVYTKTTTCRYRACFGGTNDCGEAEVTWTINPTLDFRVETDEARLNADKAAIDIFVIRDNVISTRDTRVTRIVSPNPTFGTCEVIPDPSFANGRIVRYTRPSNTFSNNAFSPPKVTCNYEVCTIPLAGETRECKPGKIVIDVKKPQASITVRDDRYTINLDTVSNRVELFPTPLEGNPAPQGTDTTNPPGRPLIVDGIVTQIPGNGANGQCTTITS